LLDVLSIQRTSEETIAWNRRILPLFPQSCATGGAGKDATAVHEGCMRGRKHERLYRPAECSQPFGRKGLFSPVAPWVVTSSQDRYMGGHIGRAGRVRDRRVCDTCRIARAERMR
jgi:hypothetical protein